jgi:hypothetical protein
MTTTMKSVSATAASSALARPSTSAPRDLGRLMSPAVANIVEHPNRRDRRPHAVTVRRFHRPRTSEERVHDLQRKTHCRVIPN